MNRKLDYSVLLLVLCCTVWLGSCTPEHEYVYRIPEQTNDGWATASLDDVGMREEPLGEMMKHIHSKEYQNVHGILIVKNEKLVFEEYFEGYTFSYTGPWSSALKFRGERTDFGIDSLHNLASVTKSFTSALVGIAIDQGHIQDVDDRGAEHDPLPVCQPDADHLSCSQRQPLRIDRADRW